MATPRIAAVQHGDYAAARRLVAAGEPEPYFGMGYTLRALDGLFQGQPHLVVSLDAPAGETADGDGRYAGVPRRAVRFLPGSAAELRRTAAVRRLLDGFKPTHLLLRTGGLLGLSLLKHARRRGLNVLALFAGVFDRSGWHNRVVTPRLARRLNDPSVFLAGNHRWPATESMVACGVDPAKAVAYDWPGGQRPERHAVKKAPADGPAEILYVGTLSAAKGVGDLVEAFRLLRQSGVAVRLTVVGDGPELPRLRERTADLALDAVRFPGRVGNAEAFARMRSAALVVVPSRPSFPEGFPLTLTEALASRTPTVLSDHPVFTRALAEGEGVRFFRAGDPVSLADAVIAALDDPAEYERLSESTAAAYARVECRTTLGELLERWQKTF
jgi:glycosyltransferase involved in cell wall biosynthesis